MPDDEFSPYGNGPYEPQPSPQNNGEESGDLSNVVAREQLRDIVERIERLEEEKQAIADDMKAVYAEAKANGFDTKVLRQVIRMRKQDPGERTEMEHTRDLYMQALGMLPDFEPEGGDA